MNLTAEQAAKLKHVDKIILDFENMYEGMQATAKSRNLDIYQEYLLAKQFRAEHDKLHGELGVLNGARKALTMLILLGLLARYGRMMFV